MAAPATTAKASRAPAGIKLEDGYSTVIAFASAPTVSFWEKTVKPPGIDGGDKIDQTTMHNTTWRTAAARSLMTLTECSGTAAYDPNVVNTILTICNTPGSITVWFPDLSSLDFFGYIQKIEFAELKEGEQPELTYTIVPTNYDPTNHVEAAPVLTSVSGT